jgi:hypothetical protein
MSYQRDAWYRQCYKCVVVYKVGLFVSGLAAHETATTSKYADNRNLGQPVSSEHKNTNSSDWCESNTENSDTSAQKSVGSSGRDVCESCCSLTSSATATDN